MLEKRTTDRGIGRLCDAIEPRDEGMRIADEARRRRDWGIALCGEAIRLRVARIMQPAIHDRTTC
jgi:hypothetical protein